MDELEKLQKTTVIELYKEERKKTLESFYSNQANTDKLIITILFAEIGFLTHYITILKNIHIWYSAPILVGIIGIIVALTSYNYSKKLLSYEKLRIDLEIAQLIDLLDPQSAELEDKEFSIKSSQIEKHVKKLSFWMCFLLLITTISSIIIVYIVKIYP